MPKIKTKEKFLSDLYEKNEHYRKGDFEVIGNYVADNVHIDCECKLHGVWHTATPSNLLRGNGCPTCGGKTVKTNEDFLKELYEKNEFYRDKKFEVIGQYVNAKTEIECKCLINPKHKNYYANPVTLLNGKGTSCRRCLGYCDSLEEFIDDLLECNEHYRNNEFSVVGEYIDSQTKIKCKCLLDPKHGYFEKAPVELKSRGNGCPKCTNVRMGDQQRKTFDQFLLDLDVKNSHYHNKEFEIVGEYVNNMTPIECKCLVNSLHSNWKNTPDNLLRDNNGCPKCTHKSTSYAENYIRCGLQQAFPNSNIPDWGDRDFLLGNEIDIPVFEKGFAVEFGSWVWHKNKWKNDLAKIELLDEKNIKLIVIYDHLKVEDIPKELRDRDNVWLYENKIYNDEVELQKVVYRLLNLFSKDYSEIDWEKVSNKAYELSSHITHQEFLSKLEKRNDYYKQGLFRIEDEYKKSSAKLKCVCNICGFVWYSTPDNLNQNRANKKHFSSHFELQKSSYEIAIEKWQIEHPLGLKKDCAKDLNCSPKTVTKYWKDSLSIVTDWQCQHPNGSKKNCVENLTAIEVKDWQSQHPNGTRKDCAKDLGKSVKTIRKYWKPFDNKYKLMVEDYRKNNPNSSRKHCADELGIDWTTVNKYWGDDDRVFKGGFKVGTKINTPQKELIRKWIKEHPNGKRNDCVRDTKLDRHTVSRNWEECMMDIDYDAFAKH